MRAFLTGSRVYGSPTNSSDVDLVVCVTKAELEILRDLAHSQDGSGGPDVSASLRFGRLNLITVTDTTDYETWAEGTRRLIERKPVTRDTAVETFKKIQGRIDDPPRWRSGDVPVEVPLIKLVSTGGTEEFWPADLKSFLEKIAPDPNSVDGKTHWGVMADWLEEHDEPDLAAAARFVAKRENVHLYREQARSRSDATRFYFSGVPKSIEPHMSTLGINTETPMGALAVLARAVAKAREEVS